MSQGFRPNRVADQIRAEIGDILVREVHDPGLGFLTVTRVQVSPDLQVARAYYSTLGDPAARHKTAQALRRAAPFVRRQIGQRLRLRRVPAIEFIFDESIEQQDRVAQLINEIEMESAASTQPSEPEGPGETEQPEDDDHPDRG
jgi:ribosome-binding factor A